MNSNPPTIETALLTEIYIGICADEINSGSALAPNVPAYTRYTFKKYDKQCELFLDPEYIIYLSCLGHVICAYNLINSILNIFILDDPDVLRATTLKKHYISLSDPNALDEIISHMRISIHFVRGGAYVR